MKRKITNPIFILSLLAILVKIGLGIFPSFSTFTHKGSEAIILVAQEAEFATESNLTEQNFEFVSLHASKTLVAYLETRIACSSSKFNILPPVKIYLQTRKFII